MNVKAVVLDVDGVITKIDSVWQYIHKKLGTLDAAKVNAEMYKRGEIDYAEWARLDVALWKGVSIETIRGIIKAIPIRLGATEFFEFLELRNLTIIAISAGLDVVTEHLRKIFRIDYALANRLVIRDSVVTGDVEVLVGYHDKGRVLKKICEEVGIKTNNCIAIGDSEVDVPMFKESALGVAFNPKDEETVKSADVVVYSEDLRSLIPIIELTETYPTRFSPPTL